MLFALLLLSANQSEIYDELFSCGIKQIFTTWCNPKGNSDTERVMRIIKEDLVWTYDWDNPFAFADALIKWINDYNSDYPHQSLNNMTPKQYHETFNQKPVPILT